MANFVYVNGTLINISRLLAVRHQPRDGERGFVTTEHYTAVFDTGKELRLEPADGAALLIHYQSCRFSPPEGNTATPSESAT